MSMTALQAAEAEKDERALHHRLEWFFKKWTPDDKYAATEFHADLVMVIQAVHRDASRETHALLMRAIAVMPNPFVMVGRPDPTVNPTAGSHSTYFKP